MILYHNFLHTMAQVNPTKEFPISLYVARIPRDTPREEIESLFQQIGPCQIRLFTDKETNEFRGIAFIGYQTIEECWKAVAQYNNYDFRGSKLLVKISDHTQKIYGVGPSLQGIAEEYKKENSMEARMDEITKCLTIVAPIEILVGSLVNKGENKGSIRKRVAGKMSSEAYSNIEAVLNEITTRVIERRENPGYA